MVLKEKINCAISIIKRKFTTICIINFIFLFIGGVIAFNHTEQWRTSEVIKLNNNNYSNYLSSIYKEIIQYNPLAKDNDSFDNENLFDDFLNKFNSNENKIDFMKLSLDDVGLKRKLDKVSVIFDQKNNTYTLRFSDINKEISKDQLIKYIDFTKNKVIVNQIKYLSDLKGETLKINDIELSKEIEIAKYYKQKELVNISQAYKTAKETHNILPMDNVGINLNDRNVNLIVFGSKILGQYITEIKNKDLGYYNSKITILEDNIRIINSLKLDIKNIEFYNVLTPSGVFFERDNISKLRIVILFIFISLLITMIYVSTIIYSETD